MLDLIIGMGEVGTGLFKVLMKGNAEHLRTYDVSQPEAFVPPNIRFDVVLHICIPYSRHFVEVVNNYIKIVNPTLVIVHSTVEVGTTRSLNIEAKVHSPVRGMHPNLAEGLETYVKYIGCDSEEVGLAATKCLPGMTCRIVKPIESSELAKLLSLARYGTIISFARDQEEMCKKYGVTYEEVVIDWEVSYNEGLLLLGRNEYIRPLITPPQGPIGGHCVVPAMREVAKDSKIVEQALKEDSADVGKVSATEKMGTINCVQSEIHPTVRIGEGTKVWRFVNLLEGAAIGEHCRIGSYVEIGRNVTIGDCCKIEAGVFIPEGVTIENNVFVGPNVVFTNDLYPRVKMDFMRMSTRVKSNVSIGANATILCGITLGRGCVVGAGSVVIRDVAEDMVVAGNPARNIGGTKTLWEKEKANLK